jgi:hypothetical protein
MENKNNSKPNEQTSNTQHRTFTELIGIVQLQRDLFSPEVRPGIRTLRTWTKNRTIPSIKLGHLVFYRPADVEAALSARTRGVKKP